MRHSAFPAGVTRDDLVSWFLSERARTREIFDIVAPEAYYDRPIALRNPIVFYEGHLPAFMINTLVKLALGRPGISEKLEILFARGIDPEDESAAKSPTDLWPSRETVQKYGAQADAIIEDALRFAPLVDSAVPQLRGGEAVLAILEHEQMHQETLLYMLHELPYEKKRRPASRAGSPTPRGDNAIDVSPVRIPRGKATLGLPRGGVFGWDNEFEQHVVDVPEFTIDARNVTNGEYLEFMTATGAKAPHFWLRGEREWYWRGMFELQPLPLDAPVYVTHVEAVAYAKWKGRRLPSEAEFHRAAFGTPWGDERLYPWGDELPDTTRGNFDFAATEPVRAMSFPSGASAWGVHDLIGNGWEWTSTIFGPFPGFEPMSSYPVYSADFFDDAHYVMKGASPVTARHLVRRSFRNWFRPNYPYVYATFRCVE